MRASFLAQQLDVFSSTSVDAPSTLQLVWSDDDDMRPSTKRHKRRKQRRSRVRKGFTSMQVHSALDLLANQVAADLAQADFSAFKGKLS